MRRLLAVAGLMGLIGAWTGARAENGDPAAAQTGPTAEAAQTMPELEDQFFDSEGVKLRYVVTGEGEPLILLHGFTANVERQWGQLIGPLSENYTVIALDERGHGKSDKPTEPGSYGMNMVEDVIRLMDHLNIEKAHVAGYSMGAGITANLISRYPERFQSAVLGGAGAPQFDEETMAALEDLAVSLEEQGSIRPLIEFLQPAGATPMTEEQMTGVDTLLMSTNDAEALAAVVRDFKNYTMTDEDIAKIDVPTVAIVGDQDPLITQVRAMEPIVEDLEVVVVPGANHMTTFMRPEFLEAVKQHLSEHPIEGADSGTPAADGEAEASEEAAA